jgi:hypothetical protein
MKSSVGTFEQYLEQALRQELDEAGLLDPNSNLELSGILLRNDVNTLSRRDRGPRSLVHPETYRRGSLRS